MSVPSDESYIFLSSEDLITYPRKFVEGRTSGIPACPFRRREDTQSAYGPMNNYGKQFARTRSPETYGVTGYIDNYRSVGKSAKRY